MAAATVERMRQILGSSTDLKERFIVAALMELLGDAAVDAILEDLLPRVPNTQLKLFGRKIGDYSGITRVELKAVFTKENGTALDDDDVDDIFLALYGTTSPTLGGASPMGTAPSAASEKQAASEEKKEESVKKFGQKPAAKKDADGK